MDRHRLILHSNAPWASTGYGQQTALFGPYLKQHYDLWISAFFGLEGAQMRYGDIPILPGIGRTFGNETIEGHVNYVFDGPRGGTVLTLMDVWVLHPDLWKKFRVASWVPVDHDPPLPPLVHNFFRITGAVPIAMSRFGMKGLEQFDPLYCPHAVDTAVYKPVDKAEARAAAGLPQDAFIVGMVTANKGYPSRKSIPQVLQAFAAFRQTHDDALLYLHLEVKGKVDGVPVAAICKSLGIPEEAVRFVDQYRYEHHPFQAELMAKVYSCFDVLMNPSMGEGFGVPMLEAQACGVPVIGADNTAMPEVVGSGWLVDCKPFWSGQMSWQALPDVEDIYETLRSAYALPVAPREKLALQAREHAKTYDVRRVMEEHMLPSLKTALQRLDEREAS